VDGTDVSEADNPGPVTTETVAPPQSACEFAARLRGPLVRLVDAYEDEVCHTSWQSWLAELPRIHHASLDRQGLAPLGPARYALTNSISDDNRPRRLAEQCADCLARSTVGDHSRRDADLVEDAAIGAPPPAWRKRKHTATNRR
jgi:hypothetical protein